MGIIWKTLLIPGISEDLLVGFFETTKLSVSNSLCKTAHHSVFDCNDIHILFDIHRNARVIRKRIEDAQHEKESSTADEKESKEKSKEEGERPVEVKKEEDEEGEKKDEEKVMKEEDVEMKDVTKEEKEEKEKEIKTSPSDERPAITPEPKDVQEKDRFVQSILNSSACLQNMDSCNISLDTLLKRLFEFM